MSKTIIKVIDSIKVLDLSNNEWGIIDRDTHVDSFFGIADPANLFEGELWVWLDTEARFWEVNRFSKLEPTMTISEGNAVVMVWAA